MYISIKISLLFTSLVLGLIPYESLSIEKNQTPINLIQKFESELKIISRSGSVVAKNILDYFEAAKTNANEADIKLFYYKLGKLYFQNDYSFKSYIKARFWIENSISRFNPDSYYFLSILYRTGLGGSIDINLAENYEQTAAELGLVIAQEHIGNKLFHDMPLPANYERLVEAYYWYMLAAYQGSDLANGSIKLISNESLLYNSEFNFLDVESAAFKKLLSYDEEDETLHADIIPKRSKNLLLWKHLEMIYLIQNQNSRIYDSSLKGGSLITAQKSWASSLSNYDKQRFQYLILYTDRFNEINEQNAYAFTKEKLWNVLRPGDYVLISDNLTHHYTPIFKVDRENNYIYFIDMWPDQLFLLKDLNRKKIRAKNIDWKYGVKLSKISKNDFYKVLLGAVILRDRQD
jgi:TPR repeat protein